MDGLNRSEGQELRESPDEECGYNQLPKEISQVEPTSENEPVSEKGRCDSLPMRDAQDSECSKDPKELQVGIENEVSSEPLNGKERSDEKPLVDEQDSESSENPKEIEVDEDYEEPTNEKWRQGEIPTNVQDSNCSKDPKEIDIEEENKEATPEDHSDKKPVRDVESSQCDKKPDLTQDERANSESWNEEWKRAKSSIESGPKLHITEEANKHQHDRDQEHSSSSEKPEKSHKELSQSSSRKARSTEGQSTDQLRIPTINSSSITNETDKIVTPRPSIRSARKRNADYGPGSESSEPQKKSPKDGAATEMYLHISMEQHPPTIPEGLESQEPEKMDCLDDVGFDTVPTADGNQAEDDKELVASLESPADEEFEMEFDRVQDFSGPTMFSDADCHHLNKRESQDYVDAKQSSQFSGLNTYVDALPHSSKRESWGFTDTKHSSQLTRPNASVGAHQRTRYREHWSFTDTKQSSQFIRPNAAGSRFLFWKFAVMLIVLIVILSTFAYWHWTSEHTAHQLIKEREVCFLKNWNKIQNRFPNQREELWIRSKILLKNHAAKATPTSPAVLMFAAAQDAQKTLHCLAREIVGAYASTFNSGVVEIDGSLKKFLNSDEMKLDMDNQLMSEFNKGKKAAVIYHFQDLPLGSSLLFYKYCDHENAAFKDISMLITVTLDNSTLEPDLSLKTIEEMVHNFLKMKYCSGTQAAHQETVKDKLSGLWSRIAHVVLPVRPENEIEAKDCPEM
ncbi:torsin-1A-interacting protein 2-like isoform X2 [Hypanus sabinus]|uniref:torsin-1A-interacting protein 2-like isoform X2 n=1 Tax=Hypanus sabinus TaxID=79690 RepID=UPI0028C39FE5|nr:torsin-1A-interacting protein 2-like isoform X2 [Hypanus sabinus]